MSEFNLLPWREQRRKHSIRRWQAGLVVAAVFTASTVCLLDRAWDHWLFDQQARQQQAEQTMAQWHKELKADALWQSRARMAQQVQADWTGWQQQQTRSWQAMQQWLSVPPRGVQIERAVWRDQQWQLNGWALSEGHWKNWQTALAVGGFSAQADLAQWASAQWRQADGIAAKQHAFQLPLSTPNSAVKP